MKILNLIFAFSLSTLIGCAATSGMAPTVERSGFDGAQIVKISLHSNDCNPLFAQRCSSFAAQWNSSKPDQALLIIQVTGEILSISSVEFNIDKKITKLNNSNVTDFNVDYNVGISSSKAAFVVPLSFIEQISSADFAWVRINSNTSYFENRIAEGKEQGWAYHAFKRFLAKIKTVQTTK